jgi:hypothetical protein
MKTISATDLQTDVDAALNSSQRERIVVSRGGKPCAVLLGIEHYDAEDLQLSKSPEFWHMIRQRRTRGRSIPLAEVESQLKTTTRKSRSPRKPSTIKKSRSRR